MCGTAHIVDRAMLEALQVRFHIITSREVREDRPLKTAHCSHAIIAGLITYGEKQYVYSSACHMLYCMWWT